MSLPPARKRSGRPWVAIIGTGLLIGAFLVVPGTTATAAPATPPACGPEAADSTTATTMAAACGTRVEVLAARTETTRVFARPDGTGEIEQYAEPQRVRLADGSWSALDTTLVANPDGSYSPRAVPVGLTVSGGGDGPLVSARRSDDAVELTWSGAALPAPVVSGSQATYPEVYPGVDLVVTARKTGFSEVLVVKDRTAAANPVLRRVAFGAELRGLRWQQRDGNLVAVDGEGRPAFGASAPRMWDSSTAPGTTDRPAGAGSGTSDQPAGADAGTGQPDAGTSDRPAGADAGTSDQPAGADAGTSGRSGRGTAGGRTRSEVAGPAVGARTAAMPVDVAGGKLMVTPDRKLLTDPATVFPVFIDPTVTYTSWTMINKNYASQSYWNYDKTDCPGTYTGECAKVGYSDWDPGNPVTYRSMWQFPTSGFKGKQILGAQFTLDLLYSWECTKSTTELEQISTTLSSSTTWNNNSGNWPGTNAATVSNESCDGARVPTEFAITSLITTIAGGSATYVTLGLKGGTESSHSGWKKFDADTARLVVSTNTVPNVPSNLTVDNKSCVVGANRPYTSTATPSLRASVADSDGNTLTASFEWARIRYDGSYGPVSDPRSQSSVASGGTALVNLPAGVVDKGDVFVGTGDWDGDGVTDALARDPNGVLYLLPGKGQVLTSRITIGSGWANYSVAGLADWDDDGHLDIIARQNSTGELWLYPGQSKRGPSTEARTLLSTGWTGHIYAGVADWDRDGHDDVIAKDPEGTLWLYPGRGGRSTGIANIDRVSLGHGWGADARYNGTIDWDRDGKPDVIVVDGAGDQWLYVGNGARASLLPYVRHLIGEGWTSYSALTMPDLSGDGKADLLAESDGKTWYAYTGSGARSYSTGRYAAGVVGISDGAYAFRARASDGNATSGNSGWCEFEVDQTNPEPPVVTADVYPSSGCPAAGCGSVGQTGRFVFDSISPDVVSYKWGFSDPPSTTVGAPAPGDPVEVFWTPTTGGAKTLYVQAVDRAGRFSQRTHQFYVAPPSPALARWKLNEPTGATTVADDTGNGRTLMVFGAPQAQAGRTIGGPSSLRFDGLFDYAGTADQIIQDTSRSFSVAAWVKLDDKNSRRNIVTQWGANTYAFNLEYLKDVDTWKFTVTSADVGFPVYQGASSAPGVPKVGVWTHLAGTFDSTAGELRLYVNGVLAATTTSVSTWNANGPTWVGGPSPGVFCGNLADVQLWNRVLTASEAAAFSDTIADSGRTLVARWDLEDVGPGPSFDASNYAHDLDFFGGAQIPASGAGHTGTGLLLDGVDAYAETYDGPVLNTDQSFTISAWANLPTGVAGNQTVVAQRGAVESGVFIKYEHSSGKWHCTYGDVDNTTGTGAVSISQNAAAKGVWTHLVCVYDAQAGLLTLYVNKVPQNAVGVTNPWRANGPMMLGRVQWRGGMFEYWSGAIDEIRVYQGVVKDLNQIP